MSPHLTLGAALCVLGCNTSATPGSAGSAGTAAAPSLVTPAANHPAPVTSGADPSDCHSPHPPQKPPGASTTALRPADRERLTTLRVSAHVGSVILRKRGSSWVTAGEGGCTVPSRRIDLALDELGRLEAKKTDEQPENGGAFELQIVALMDEEIALQLDIAKPSGGEELVQLLDGSRVRMRGLDRRSWSARPADWCNERDHALVAIGTSSTAEPIRSSPVGPQRNGIP